MLSLTDKFFLIYMLSLIAGNMLVYIDIKNGKVDRCIFNLFNNSEYNLKDYITKDKFLCVYKFVTIFLYFIPIINTIVLILHLLLDYIENRK